jgi:hypothetical protein
MSSRIRRLAVFASLAFVIGPLSFTTASAQPAPGDLSGLWTRGPAAQSWYRPPESGPGPIANLTPPPPDAGGGTGTIYVGDHLNPVLQPWAAEEVLRKANLAQAGTPEVGGQQVCRPHGVPFILGLNDAVQILHTPDHFILMYAREMRTRIVYMNAPHPDPTTLRHSQYGHSVGHWEGDTLVVDTIGLSDDTWTDRLGTPHTESLRVVERYRKLSDTEVRVDFMVEDPGAFTIPWHAYVGYRPEEDSYTEQVCAENNRDPITGLEHPIPRDDTPDF